MVRVTEINDIGQLAPMRQAWSNLLEDTPSASFFQSLDWLEAYWRHFGEGQRLRVLAVWDDDRPLGILPLTVRRQRTRVGSLRVLNYPLHDWGSFYGPIGPAPQATLSAGLEHICQTPRDWDFLELRWLGGIGTELDHTRQAMRAAGFQCYPTAWNHTAVVDLAGTWESYWESRPGAWRRRFRHSERELAEQGAVSHVRYRPLGRLRDDASPRWDLYDACEELARRSWQGGASDGTTLSHEAVRGFLRDLHVRAAEAGTLDLNLLLVDGTPAAFIYGYQYRGYVSGLRRGFDADKSRAGAGNVLLAYTLRDSFARGDGLYDMGVGSLETKRYFQTRVLPVMRMSHFPRRALRAQLLRVKRWWQARRA